MRRVDENDAALRITNVNSERDHFEKLRLVRRLQRGNSLPELRKFFQELVAGLLGVSHCIALHRGIAGTASRNPGPS